jgi:hypothetical protein
MHLGERSNKHLTSTCVRIAQKYNASLYPHSYEKKGVAEVKAGLDQSHAGSDLPSVGGRLTLPRIVDAANKFEDGEYIIED